VSRARAFLVAPFALALGLSALAQANSGWVNSQEGCWCGYQTSLPRIYKVVGNGSTLADRQAGADMLTEWNRYATMFNVQVDPGNVLGGNNGTNELNVFITSADSLAVYGFTMTTSLFGRAVMWPNTSFGNFNECKDFTASGCGPFTETDVVINAGFSHGWTNDWFGYGADSDPGNPNPAVIQTTALHEVGHTLGLHHVFTLPAFGDSFSTMNYINDDAGKFVTRMDAKTLRAEYVSKANALTDMAIYPFVFGNSQYGETYASTSATNLNAGDNFTLNNFRISNVGSQTAAGVVVTFYLVPAGTRQYPQPTDLVLGTASYGAVVADAEGDQTSTPLSVPGYVPSGTYNLGAIVTVNGAEDSAFVAGKPNNNRFIVGHGARDVLTVTNPNPAGIYIQSHSETDVCSGGGAGNGDGVLDPGENVTIAVTARSSFSGTATGVTGTLSSTTPGVTITSPTASFGTLATGAAGVSSPPFGISLSPTIACGTTLSFTLTFASSQGGTVETFTLKAGQTSPGASTTVLSEAFESSPAGWTVLNDPTTGRGWVLSSYSGCVGGSSYPYTNNTGGAGQFVHANSDCLGGAMDTILYSPSFSLANPAYVSAQVQFQSDFHDYLNRDQGWVDVSPDGGTTWYERMYFNRQDYRGPITQTIDLTPYLGNSAVKLRFEYESPNWDWYWQVDDVVVTAVQQGACSSHACAPSSCTLTCTATVPATGAAGASVAFASTATPSNCAGTPTYDWNFGDGTAHSALQNPSHTFVSAGTFNWSLAVSVNGVPCSKSGSITISGMALRKSGDCDGDGTVSLAELQQVVSNQLGTASTGCGDCDGGGQVSITEIQKAVNCQLGLPSCEATCQN
jgi:PKD repeat protein